VKINRLTFLATVCAGFGAVVPMNALAMDQVRVGKSVEIAFTFIQPDVGIDAKIWPKYNIDPTITNFAGDAKMMQALTAGSIDFGLGSGPSLSFMAKGVPAKGVAAFFGAPINISVIVKYDSPIKSVADLKGKKIGITTAGSLTEWLTRRLALWQKWNQDEITTVSLGSFSAQTAALRSGQIDAVMSSTEAGDTLEERKVGRNLINAAQFVPDFHGMVIFARDELIKDRSDLVQRFVNGFFASVAYIKAHKEQTIEVGQRVLGMSKQTLDRAYTAEVPEMSDDGQFKPKAVSVLKESFIEMKVLDRSPGDDTMFTTQFVPSKP
jgi:NitT/TauT family transport system substrate-binding protein